MDHKDKLKFFPNGFSGPCDRCGKFSPGPEQLLSCSRCKGLVHIECLRTKPRCLLVGDNFYTLTCFKCYGNKEDSVVRPKFLSRLQALIIVLFHLHKTSTESSCQGFFHVEDHISEFIIGYWEDIFGPNSNIKKRAADGRRSLFGVQDVLMQHPQYFVKGPESLGDGKWYKLSTILPPAQLLHASFYLDSKTNEACEEVSSTNGVTRSTRKRFRADKTDSPKPPPPKKKISSLSEVLVKTEPTDNAIIGSNSKKSPGQVTVKQEPVYMEEVFVAEFTGEEESSEDPLADIDGDQTTMPSTILFDDVTYTAPENIKEFSNSKLVKVLSEKPSRLIKPKIISAPQPQIISCDEPKSRESARESVSDNVQDAYVPQIKMRTLTCAMLLLTLNGATAWFCYTHEVGTESSSIAFCPTVSCFSVGGHVLGIGDSQKGCADKAYPTICQSASFNGLLGEHACFCNTFLCNTSAMPSIFMPLLIIPWLLQRLL